MGGKWFDWLFGPKDAEMPKLGTQEPHEPEIFKAGMLVRLKDGTPPSGWRNESTWIAGLQDAKRRLNDSPLQGSGPWIIGSVHVVPGVLDPLNVDELYFRGVSASIRSIFFTESRN